MFNEGYGQLGSIDTVRLGKPCDECLENKILCTHADVGVVRERIDHRLIDADKRFKALMKNTPEFITNNTWTLVDAYLSKLVIFERQISTEKCPDRLAAYTTNEYVVKVQLARVFENACDKLHAKGVSESDGQQTPSTSEASSSSSSRIPLVYDYASMYPNEPLSGSISPEPRSSSISETDDKLPELNTMRSNVADRMHIVTEEANGKIFFSTIYGEICVDPSEPTRASIELQHGYKIVLTFQNDQRRKTAVSVFQLPNDTAFTLKNETFKVLSAYVKQINARLSKIESVTKKDTDLIALNEALVKENLALKEENASLKEANASLKEANASLTDRVNDLERLERRRILVNIAENLALKEANASLTERVREANASLTERVRDLEQLERKLILANAPRKCDHRPSPKMQRLSSSNKMNYIKKY